MLINNYQPARLKAMQICIELLLQYQLPCLPTVQAIYHSQQWFATSLNNFAFMIPTYKYRNLLRLMKEESYFFPNMGSACLGKRCKEISCSYVCV